MATTAAAARLPKMVAFDLDGTYATACSHARPAMAHATAAPRALHQLRIGAANNPAPNAAALHVSHYTYIILI